MWVSAFNCSKYTLKKDHFLYGWKLYNKLSFSWGEMSLAKGNGNSKVSSFTSFTSARGLTILSRRPYGDFRDAGYLRKTLTGFKIFWGENLSLAWF